MVELSLDEKNVISYCGCVFCKLEEKIFEWFLGE